MNHLSVFLMIRVLLRIQTGTLKDHNSPESGDTG